MRRAILAAAALLLAGCVPGVWQARRRVDAGRLYLPHLYAPLVPGSMYPDKRRPIPVEGRPGVLVVLPPAARRAEAVEALGERGLVALVTRPGTDLDAAARWLRERPECRGARVAAIVPAGVAVPRELAAVAVMGAPAESPRLSPSAFFAAAGGVPPGVPPGWHLEKWYRPDARGRLPVDAWRDAAEWLALTLAP